LKEFNFSGNSKFNKLDLIPDLLENGANMKRLILKDLGIHSIRVDSLRLKDVGKLIKELDISDNDYFSNISSFSYLKESPDFTVFLANNSVVDNTFLK